MSENYNGNGNYILEYCNLYSKDENTDEELVWDLVPHFVEASLFESITSPTMSGYIAVIDAFNANELLPLYGGERIELSFYTAGNEEKPIEYIGYVFKVSPKHRLTEHSTGYKISFCSEASILSKRTFTHMGMTSTISQMVSDIYSNHLLGRTRKLLETSSTKGVLSYTFGATEPLDAISVLSRRASGTDSTVGYLFYENNQTFKFESIQQMYQRDIVASYTNRQAGVYEETSQRNIEQFESIQGINIDEENSFMDRMMDGIHGSNFGHFNLMTKTFTNFHYRKNDDFDPSKSLGSIPDKKFVDDGNDTQSIAYESSDPLIWFDEARGIMKLIESETFRAKVSVFGDSNLKSGDLIRLSVPNWNVDQENVKTGFDGSVLISSIRHTITPKTYAQVLGVRKDAYEELV